MKEWSCMIERHKRCQLREWGTDSSFGYCIAVQRFGAGTVMAMIYDFTVDAWHKEGVHR